MYIALYRNIYDIDNAIRGIPGSVQPDANGQKHEAREKNDEDVVVLTIQLLLGHVSLVLLHQVSSDFDYIVIVVNVISDK